LQQERDKGKTEISEDGGRSICKAAEVEWKWYAGFLW